MSAQVRDDATTLTDATPSGARPVRASTRCAPRCAVPDVATAPVRTGSTASTRRGSCGSSMPTRQAGDAGSSVRTTMSPPAERAKSVSVQGAQPAGRALHGPALHDPARVQPLPAVRPGQPGPERAVRLARGALAECEDLRHLGRAVGEVDLAAVEPGDERGLAGRC